jgi:hypothetical protein
MLRLPATTGTASAHDQVPISVTAYRAGSFDRLALQDELRTLRGERAEVLRPESRFRDAATIYIGKVTARREDSTTDVYSYWLEKLVLPQLGELRLGECDVAQMDAFFAAWSAAGGS